MNEEIKNKAAIEGAIVEAHTNPGKWVEIASPHDAKPYKFECWEIDFPSDDEDTRGIEQELAEHMRAVGLLTVLRDGIIVNSYGERVLSHCYTVTKENEGRVWAIYDAKDINACEPVEPGDRIAAMHFAYDEGLRIWPMLGGDSHRPVAWRLMQVEGTGPDATITELDRAELGHWLELKYPEAKWGVNDNLIVPPGTEGTVERIAAGQISVKWDNGSTLNLAERDWYRIVV